ncbi:MAG: mechanosensitive ion channel [Bacteroidales bacterium]|nr:mechanosensitive ion channel [Bacteroidales bacterium]
MLKFQDKIDPEKFNVDSLHAKSEEALHVLKTTEPDVLLHNLAEQAIQFGIKVLAALAIYIIGGFVIKWIKALVNRGFARKKADATLSSFVNSLISIVFWIILIIIMIGTLGINTTSLAALLAAGGMAIGMALSGTVQNFAGGIMLLVFKPFKAGDVIEAQGYMGIVTSINITSTKLTTFDNKVIYIPNGALSSGNINNYSDLPLRRVDLNVSVGYGTDIDEAKKLILNIIAKNKKILDTKTAGVPADPFVALLSLKDSCLEIVTRCWVKSEDYWDVFFSLTENIYKELPKNGISFPFPQMDVHIKNS